MDEARERQIGLLALLQDPVRRRLYLYASRQRAEVGRDEAARAVGVSRGLAAYHLDSLVEAGLLRASYRRLSGREGPGAGRPSKLYGRSEQRLEVSLPPRRYELAARLLAQAVQEESTGSSQQALQQAAQHLGAKIAEDARGLAGPASDREQLVGRLMTILDRYGFEPYRTEGAIRLHNCPFDALVNEYRDLVCGMNLSVMQGLLTGLGANDVQAGLDPQPGMCCVALRYADLRAE